MYKKWITSKKDAMVSGRKNSQSSSNNFRRIRTSNISASLHQDQLNDTMLGESNMNSVNDQIDIQFQRPKTAINNQKSKAAQILTNFVQNPAMIDQFDQVDVHSPSMFK